MIFKISLFAILGMVAGDNECMTSGSCPAGYINGGDMNGRNICYTGSNFNFNMNAPTCSPPTTEAPNTTPMATSGTEAPTTEAAATATEAATTDVPTTTEAPTTDAPTTARPITTARDLPNPTDSYYSAELAIDRQEYCELTKKMAPLWAEHEAHYKDNCMPICTAQENHEFETCTQFDAACMKQATAAYADRSWSYDGDDDRDYFDVYTEQLEFFKQCPDAHLDGFGRCADTGGTHDGYDDSLSWMYRDDGDDDQTCASFCAEVKAGTAYEDDYLDDDDDSSYSENACDAFDATVVAAAAACKTDGDCTELNAAFSKAEQDAAAVRYIEAVSEALGNAAAKSLAASSDRCVAATKLHGLYETIDAHYQANCVSMCTASKKHEFTACTQFEAACLKEATDTIYADDDGNDSYDHTDHDARFELESERFEFLKKCPEADLAGFGACARDGDHEGYDDDWDDDDDRTCPEFCAAVAAGEAYDDDYWDDDDDSSYSEQQTKTACAAYDDAVAAALETCEADNTCAAIGTAVKEAAGEQAAADAFNYGSAATSLTVGAATLFAAIVTMLV
jgi:hypothetical protein